MTRTLLPFHSEDISALARALGGQLAAGDHKPGHVELLNMLARATGYRNFQHFRAQMVARQTLDEEPSPAPPPVVVNHKRVLRLFRLFDDSRRLTRWPPKWSERELCLWALWADIPVRRVFTEREISAWLGERHLFGDHALLRRCMVELGMMTRTADGTEYRRVEGRPPPDALALIGHLRGRASAVSPPP